MIKIWNNYIDKFQQIMTLYDIVDHYNKTTKDTDQSTHFLFYSKFSHNKFIFLVDFLYYLAKTFCSLYVETMFINFIKQLFVQSMHFKEIIKIEILIERLNNHFFVQKIVN